jgi:hypothetical protein
MLNGEIKKKIKKGKKMNQNESSKLWLIYQIHNLLNHRSGVNQETQFIVK